MAEWARHYFEPVITGLVLLAGVAVALRTSGTGGGGRAKRKRRHPVEPAPVAGGAEGLLDAIPTLERVPRGRMRGSAKLAVAILGLSSILAVVLYVIGRGIGGALSHVIK